MTEGIHDHLIKDLVIASRVRCGTVQQSGRVRLDEPHFLIVLDGVTANVTNPALVTRSFAVHPLSLSAFLGGLGDEVLKHYPEVLYGDRGCPVCRRTCGSMVS